MMKHVLIFAASAAAVLAAGCARNEVYSDPPKEEAVSFGVYAGKAATKATYGDINNITILANSDDGFGAFAYYTKATAWESAKNTATPNFMYNQQVRHTNSYTETPEGYTLTKYPASWYYTPLKYWPNGTNSTTVETGIHADFITFFAYAPYISKTALEATPTEGITAISANTNPGAPTVNFTVPAKSEEQIDLLWAIPLTNQDKKNVGETITFNFKHALSKLNVKVQAVVDAVDPVTANLDSHTHIILESLELKADGTKSGVLTIDSNDATAPSWSSKSGESVVTYTSSSFTTTTVNGKTGFNVTETATALNAANAPMIIPAEVASGKFVITANYWVITEDSALDGGYSTVQQVIKKTSDAANTFQAGKQHDITVRLGLTNVSFAVNVVDWEDGSDTNVDLPINTNPAP